MRKAKGFSAKGPSGDRWGGRRDFSMGAKIRWDDDFYGIRVEDESILAGRAAILMDTVVVFTVICLICSP
jgi:hypothetical protein